ncbi:MAG TPA: hypothetical protein VE974_19845 [Thermoanaerobaculia bacterium]|nr:hypothetical protein [Thermoanaerobaculia bacterium]
MSPKPSKAPLERTSIQLPRQTIEALESWPTLNRSEALRLTVERYHYLESIAGPAAENLVDHYRPVFQVALEDLTFDDYKVVARSLPMIVSGAMAEEGVRDGVEREHRALGHGDIIDWKRLQQETAELNPIARIYLLDFVVMERHREAEQQTVSPA